MDAIKQKTLRRYVELNQAAKEFEALKRVVKKAIVEGAEVEQGRYVAAVNKTTRKALNKDMTIEYIAQRLSISVSRALEILQDNCFKVSESVSLSVKENE